MTSLLPPNATPLERALEKLADARLGGIATPLRDLWNPQTCPPALLPWLAWALSIDGWDANWPLRIKRARVAQAIAVQRYKGTTRSVADVVSAFGGSIAIREWWQIDPPGTPHTFDLTLALSGLGGEEASAEFVDQVVAEVTRTKPLRSHFTFTQALTSATSLGVVGAARAAIYVRLSMDGLGSDNPVEPQPDPPINLTRPIIHGLALVGQTLTMEDGAWTDAPEAPANTVRPTITGTPQLGSILTVDQGSWTGSAGMTFSRQWLRNDAAIPGETGTSYLIKAEDENQRISVRVTATNVAGSASATSDSVLVEASGPVEPEGLARLTWPYDAGYVFEASASGTKIGTIQDVEPGAALSIISVADATGAPAANDLFALSGGDLVCGARPIDFASGGPRYALTIRKTLGGEERDTVMWVQVDPLAKQGSFSDDFDAPDGTRLVDRPGWIISTRSPGDATSLAGIKIVGNALSVGNAGAALDVYCEPASSSYSVRAKVAGALSAQTPSICAEWLGNVSGGYVRAYCGGSGRVVTLAKKNGDNVATTLLNFDPGSANPVRPGDEFGIDIDRAANRAYLVFRGQRVGNAAGYSIDDITPARRVGVGTVFGAAAGGPQLDDFTISSLAAFAIDPFPCPIFQKGAAGYGWIPLSGTYAGEAPASLQYRIETSAGALVADWAAHAAQIGDGTFRGYIPVPTGGPYIVKVRDPASPGVEIASSAVRVGSIVLGYGQSNMAGLMNTPSPAAIDATNGNGLISLGGNSTTPGNPASPTNYNAAGLINAFVALIGEPVLFFNRAVAGQPLQNLVPGTAAFATLELDLWRYRGRIGEVLIDQGEGDTGTDPVAWSDGWNQLVRRDILGLSNQRSSEVSAYMAYTLGRTDTGIINNASVQAGHYAIRRAQKRWATLDTNNMVSHHKFDMDYGTGETIHQSAADRVNKHGPRYAYSIAKKRGLIANNRMGPLITGGARAGAVITLAIDLNGASGLVDPGGTPGGWQLVAVSGWTGAQDPNGYFVTPAATPPLPIASVRVVGNAIVITLASDPGGPVALRYPAAVIGSLFDGCQPFGQPYTDVGGQAAAPQIKGTYPDGNVGVAPLIDAIVIP